MFVARFILKRASQAISGRVLPDRWYEGASLKGRKEPRAIHGSHKRWIAVIRAPVEGDECLVAPVQTRTCDLLSAISSSP